MAQKDGSFNITAELLALKHEMKNRDMKSLPSNMTVQRRPIYHPPVASPYAGAQVQKLVYVSRNTPIMSAVKRVKKLLVEIEKRANQSTEARNYGRRRTAPKKLDFDSSLAKASEEVLVKASGKAMAQALRVGEWFRTKETGMLCQVEVRTSSVQAIDDIVEADESESELEKASRNVLQKEHDSETTTVLEGGETTMELLGDSSKSETNDASKAQRNTEIESNQQVLEESTVPEKKKRRKRKRAKYDKDDCPEARLRWVKTVEVAISLTI